MRPIKFRGMTISGEWVYGFLSVLPDRVLHLTPGSYISTSRGFPFEYQVRPETVGQFSGLTDKNGKDIYEGDILKPWSEEIGPYTVSFENGAFVCYHKRGKWGLLSRAFEIANTSEYQVEVIGNRYETPELINQPQINK